MDTRAAIYGVQPCPECGSDRVKWRGRRLYDRPLTWIRGTLEVLLRTMGVRTQEATGELPETLQWEYERRLYDDRMSFKTADRFWRCRACKKSGQQFDDIDFAQRERIAALEAEISYRTGAVSDPIDGDRSN